MPPSDQILSTLKLITNSWWGLAMFWHIYFAAIIIALIIGKYPKKRLFGIIISLPILSVSFLSWLTPDHFNGIVFALVAIFLLYFFFKLPDERVKFAPFWVMFVGTIVVIFGWIYPLHFLETSSVFSYIYASPTGLIPCPTLSIVIGFIIILNNLNSFAISIMLGLVGLFYGLVGVLYLGVMIDTVLSCASILILTLGILQKRTLRTANELT